MSRKRTVRRVWVKLDPIAHAIYQASLLTNSEWDAQILPVRVAMEQLSQGNWNTRENWSPMFQALNRIEAMLVLKHMPDHGFIEQSQAVFTAALGRMEATGATAFKADELAAMRYIVVVYGDLLTEVTHREFQDACDNATANEQRITRSKTGINVAGCSIEVKKPKHPKEAA